ncbi:non-ribosomal peptide synthase/polyketide synthase [Xenorhabdus stockiae]
MRKAADHVSPDFYPLHPAQENVFYEQILYENSAIHTLNWYTLIEENVDITLLQKTWNLLYQHIDTLRLRIFINIDNEAVQYIQEQSTPVLINEYDVSRLPDPENSALQWMKQQTNTPIDYLNEIPYQFTLIRLNNEKNYFFTIFHHIFIDGVGLYRFHEYVYKLYRCLKNGTSTTWLSEIPKYLTTVKKTREYLSNFNYESDKNYWLDFLKKNEIYQLKPYYQKTGTDHKTLTFPLSVKNELRAFCHENNISISGVFYSLISIIMAKLTGQQELVFNTTTHGRTTKSEKYIVGMQANMYPIHCLISQDSLIVEQVKKVESALKSSHRHGKFPSSHFTRLAKQYGFSLPNILILYDRFSASATATNQIQHFHVDILNINPIVFRLKDHGYDQELKITVQYLHAYFSDSDINNILERLNNLLTVIIDNPAVLVSELPILLEQERDTLLNIWNQTDTPYPQDKTLPQLFEAQAIQRPDATAIIFEDQSISYGELNRRANQLAHHLIALGVRPDDRVAICLERSPDMVVGILAILKAGGAYLSLDPAYPVERLTYMLEDAAPVVLLTQTTLANKLTTSVPTVWLENTPLDFGTQPDTNPETQARGLTSRHLAYVIYTSGSTGQPKGVMVEHRNVLRLIINNGFADIGPDDCVAHCANPTFDAATWEIWSALLNGSCLHIVPQAVLLEPTSFREALRKGKVTALCLTVGLFNEYLDTLQAVFGQLRYLLVGGDVLNPQKIKQVLSADHPPVHLLNGYGPTESTTFAMTYEITAPVDVTQSIPIGRPIANTRIYLLDADQQPVPMGALGEIYIGGDGVARGYLNQPELTTARFLADPFSPVPGARMYKTGDLGRYLPDGSIEYLGRNDFQVKIRGYRIELGEIESALTAHPQIKQAVVIDREHQSHKVLVAYLVAEDAISDEMLLTHLSDRLPDYMLPASFTLIEAIPLTLNGKVDRRALSEPVFGDIENYAAPRNALETQLCEIWQAVLGLEQVSIHDNFFRIGGDSIVSIQLVSKLRQAGFSLQVKTFFESPTVAQLAQLLMQTTSTSKSEIIAEQGLLNGEFALLPIQQTFFDWPLAQPHHWNQAFMVQIPGHLQAAQLEHALIALAERHDILRAYFIATEQGYCQCYSAQVSASLPRLKHADVRQCDPEALRQQLTQWQSGFDYHNGPLWQAAHLTGYADDSARLFFACHHLIIDAVSWRIIAEDMRLLLQGMTLSAKTSSYRQWVAAVQEYARQHQHEVPYWQQVLAGHHNKPALDNLTHHQLGISAEMTDILLHEANAGYHTEINDLLLSALTVALQETFDQSANHIILESHGRESIDNTIDVSETVGWFTTLYPVRLENQTDIVDTLIHTKEMLRTVPNKGMGYGALEQAGYLDGDLPSISFNYLGQLGCASHQDWSITDDDCGTMIASENDSHVLLGINGAVQTGRLRFYVDSRLPQPKTTLFIRAFEQALHDVISVAQKQAQAGGIKTASDYGIKGLSVTHLRQLQQHYQLEALYPATSLQQGFVYHHLAQPQDDAYRVQLLLDYHTAIDVAAYQQAWTLASLRFPILRTAFNWSEDVLQIVTAGASIGAANFDTKDISQLPEEMWNEAIDTLQQSDRTLPFDLSRPGLARFTLIKQHQQLVTVLITLHHSIIDGWSYPILLQTVHSYYNALAQGRQPDIVVDNAYLATQQYYRDHLTETDLYWSERKTQWQGANDLSALLSHRVDLTQIKTVEKPAEQQLTVQGNAYEQLKNTCRAQGITLNVALQFAWHKLLHIYTGDEQTIVGTTVSGRDIPVAGIESSVGLYINTLPLAVQWGESDNIATILQNIQKDIADFNSYSAVPLSGLQSDGKRLFQSLLVFENYPVPVADENQAGIEQTLTFRRVVEKVDYPLSLIAYEQGDRFIIKFNYGEDWLTDEQAQRLLRQLERILHAVACHPEQPHTTITCLSEAERHTLLHGWNQTAAPYPQDKTLQQLFEEQVERTPNAIALKFADQILSYTQVNQNANQLAHYLRTAFQIAPDTLIGVCMERSTEMVVALLAILKAGGAYVPLDPNYPKERLDDILYDAAPRALLCHREISDEVRTLLTDYATNAGSCVVDLNTDIGKWSCLSHNNPSTDTIALTSSHLAYVIYTSGSTGKPKGVMNEHRGVVNRLVWMQKAYPLTADDVVLQKTPFSFDVSVWEFFWPLMYGAGLVVAKPEGHKDPLYLSQLICQHNITTLHFVPSMLSLFLQQASANVGKFVRRVFCSGEALPVHTVLQFHEQFADVELHNLYGPTEAAIDVAAWDCSLRKTGDLTKNSVIPIGKPIDNIQLYILDNDTQPVPIGVAGELYISGIGVARGYLNKPELTAEKFIRDPFSSDPKKKMYRTGDLARYLSNGNIEYLGRNDFQVKIRGLRIELGEIEGVLTSHPQVRQAVVVDREHSGHKGLAAYLVAGDAISADMLLAYLFERLPDYMLPTSFTFIDAIPLTQNGKVDRKALPEPAFDNRDNYVAPRNALETQLCTIWQTVLGLEQVGIEDNFFRIGGNSLTAIKLIAAIHRTLSTDISLAQLFELKTIAGLVTQIEAQICIVIPHRTQKRYPLSFAQERMLFIEQYEQGSDVYHIPYLVQLAQEASLPLLETAINRLAERHAVLRTVYRSDDHDQSYQQVLETDLVFQSQSCDNRDSLLVNVRTEIATPFDLTTEPSLRLRHYQVADSHYLLLLWHHIAMDGWSIDIFMTELAEVYHALQAGRDSQLPALDITYGDYAAWQRDYLQGDIREQQLAYWQQTLAGYESLALPTDHPRPAQVNYQGRDINFTLDAQLSEQLRTLAKTQETTLYTVLLSAVYVTLAKLSGQDDIVIGTPTDNRHHAQTLPLLGMFVNSLALRAQLQHTDSVTALIAQVHKRVSGAKAHQDMPFEQLVEALNIERDTARHPLFQVMFSVQAFDEHNGGENPSANRLPFKPVTLDEPLYSPAKFDLSLFLSDGKTAITGCLNYALSLFNDTSITRIVESYQRVLRAFVANQQQPLSSIDILSAQERHTLLYRWNQTDAPYPQDKTLSQLFEVQTARTPDNVALVFEGKTLTYRQLSERANQLARVIRERYQQQHYIPMPMETLIVLYLDRSPEMVIGILAVLKAGGAYVPVSPDYPPERVQFMLDDTQSPCVVTQQQFFPTLQAHAQALVTQPTLIATDDSRVTEHYSTDNLALAGQAIDLAYVIYTSGTTGKPKGVLQTHHNVNRLFTTSQKDYQFDQHDVWILFHAYTFDFSVWELWGALLYGGRLIIPTVECTKDFNQLSQLCTEQQVTVLNQTPGAFYAFIDEAVNNCAEFPHLRYVIFGGDKLNPVQLTPWWDRYGDLKPVLINMYGITETTVHVTYKKLTQGDTSAVSCIGRPLSDMSAYILNSAGQLAPIGSPGELYIGGAGLARGYLNRPELTAERFIENPFATDKHKKLGYTSLYKTGDLARWLPDGELEYLGRNDFQVKIRGYRIELGEIESTLVAHPQIKQAVVIDCEYQGNTLLSAYLVIDGFLADEALLAHLSAHLPDYMLPASFTFIEAIPLTLNGKVDRSALPEPVFGHSENYVAPRNALETQLCEIWQAVLGLEQVSIHDNFFRIGGDSIVSIQLASKLRQAGFSLQVKTLFEAPTVAQLAPLLLQTKSKADIVAEQGVLNGEFALLPIQHTFFDWPLAQPHHWNQSFMVQIPGHLQAAQLEQALMALTDRHDMLRARFVATEQGYHQCYFADISASLPQLKHADIRQCDTEALRQQLTQWQSGFDYHNGPLWQAAHLTGYADGSARLFFAFHHLIIDAVSWRIIAEDMRLLLQGMALSAKTSSYRQWVAAVQEYARQHQHEVPYWQQVLAGHHSKPALDSLTHHQLGLSAEMTDILLHEANKGYHTEINDLLLSALTVALQETFDQSANHIILESHGRESIDNTIDVSETVGWFTTLYPVRLENQTDIVDTLIHTKEMLRAVPNKGMGYGALEQAGYLDGDLPSISFNYLGQLGSASRQNWSITDDDCGTMIASENDSHVLLGINGAVQTGRLRFYVDSRLPQPKTALFIRAFGQALHDVISVAQKQAQAGGIKTASDYGIKGLSVKQLRHLQQHYQLEALYPATSLQQGFIYHHLAQPQDDAYRVQLLLDYHTAINVDVYQQAWALASLRFPILRTAFDWAEDLLQIVIMGASINAANFQHEDITQLPEEEKNRAIGTLQQHDLTLPFDLRQPGLARFILIKQHQQLVTVVITLHHSIIDGWSYPILLQTVHDYYNVLAQGRQPDIVVDNAYLATQQYYRDHLTETDLYWSERKTQWQGANDLSALLSHRVDLTRIKAVNKTACQQLIVQGNAYEQLKNTCRTQGITLNVALQFAWHKLLHIYTSDEQTIVGTTVSGRDIPVTGIESSVGLYINTLPLVVQWKPTGSVVTILQHIQKTIADLNSYSAVSLSGLQSDGKRLFQSLLVFENYPVPVADENQTGIEQTLTFRRVVEKVDYPLSLIAYEQGNQFIIRFNYGEDWLTDEQAQRLLNQLERILHALACHPEQPHTTITCLSEAERHTLLHSWNQTDAPYPQDKTLPQLFEAQAAQHPDAIAVEFEEQVLSYGELNCRANRLAHYLMTQGVGPDERVAICVERSPEMVVGLLAILKAGGAYVPLDPAHPDERLAHMLEDSAPVVLLTQSTLAHVFDAALPSVSYMTVLLDKQAVYLTEQPDHNPDVQALAPHHLAYVIYTSGSTGLPKGVEMPQSALSNLLHWHHYAPEHPTTTGKTLQFAALGFDVAFQEIFTTLCEGGCLVLINEALRREPQQLLKLVQQKQIERVFLPYVALQHFADAVNLNAEDDLSCLKHIITAGEQLRITPAIQHLMQRAGHCRLHNHYGPTESHAATSYTLDNETEYWPTLPPIGRPIANTQIYILDPYGQPVPWGVTGEIYIAGQGVARGYLNRPELTAERFLNCPFSAEPGARMYKTGDLGRWLPDGNIDYLGRNDFQVKIRGFRIELGEIENALAAHPQVKQVVVIDREHSGHKVLAAYLVVEDAVSDDMLLAHLSDRLPDYMLPASFTVIDAIPLTLNGKVNRSALPEPVFGNRESYAAPRNTLETQLCTIWQNVLGLERVGTNDNFFRIGGHSLTAIKLIAAIRRTLSTDISLTQLFELKTISGLATQMEAQICTVIPPLAQARYPLSFAQERMLFIEQFEQGSDVYHIPYLVQLAQEASLPVLEAAINRLAERHAVLSTVYRSDDQDLMYQQILETHFVIPSQDCDDRATLLAKVSTEIATPFDLTTEPSLRLRHYQVADNHYLLLLWHHIAMDGWSTDIFMAELAEVYHALQSGRDSQLPELEITYGDYAAWQRDYLQGDIREQQLSYWQHTLAGYESLALPTDHPRPAQVNYQGRDVHFTLDAQLSEQLRTLAKTQETTLYTVLLSAFYVTLAKLSGQDDIVIGTPTDNRHHAQTLPLLGMFVNSLALRAQLQHTDGVTALIAQVHKLITGAKAHQDMPFEQLIEALNIERDTARHPLFQVMFSVQAFGENPSDGNLPFSPVALDETLYSPAKFDLSLFLSDGKTAITGCLNYALSLFNNASITRIAESYQRVLSAFVADQQQPLSSIDILSAQERHTLLHRWNQTDTPYPQNKTLSQLFEAQAAQRPDSTAIVFEDQSISYSELNRRANQLAHHLIDLGVKPDNLVAICLERSLNMVVGILAILKAGGAYLPLDPAYPAERLSYMLDDATPVALLTQTALADKLTCSVPTVLLDNPTLHLEAQPDTNPDTQALGLTSNHLAYVIYTSGSTGQPKGVMVEHRNVLRLIINNGFADIGPDDCVAHCANPAFDAATWEIWSALLNGSCLHIVPQAVVLEPAGFREALIRGKVTALWLTAGLFNEYLDTLQPVFGQLRYLLVGGDILNPQKIKQVLSADHPPAHLLNGYGPTESTTFATTYAITAPVDGMQSIPIGRPIANTRIYLLDAHQQPVPMGAPGEIYISGEGVARGYLNQPALTTERFLADPFSSESEAKMYKTGDLGRYLPDGNIDYLGRNDSQVKVRGFRIELGEIENALAAHPQVKQAVVIDREHSGHKVLAAYLVIEDAVSDDMLLTHLSDRLPDYMLPASFTFMDAIPLTLNGKVNRRALPEPVFGNRDSYVAPRNVLETQLCAIWQDVLELERVGIDDNFFRIGGNSLTAIKLIAAIRRTLSTDISLAQLFELKTIAGLATQMDTQIHTVIPPLAQARYPLSFAQERMLFIEQFEQGSDVYHIPYLVQLAQEASLPVLEAAINRLAERHAVLSTVYRSDDHDQMYQQALETHFVIPSQTCDDRATLLANVRSEISTPFDLATEPSLRLRHYQVADRHYLLLLWHHIAMDGWSTDIFMAELAEVYHALQSGRDSQLPELEITYGDYAAWQRDYLQGDIREQQLAYWQHTLAGYESLALPTDHPRPAQVNYQGRDAHFALDAQLSEQLRTLAKTQETTLYTVLLSAFYVTLAKLTGQDDIVIGTPTDNRHHAQTLPLLGMFVNSLALRAQLQHTDGVTALIAQVHKLITGAKAHQDMPFEQLIEALNIERDTARHPLFQVMFSMQAFGENPSDGNLPFSPVALDETLYSPAKFDLSLFLSDGKTAITGCLNYAVSLFNDTSITRIAESYQRVLNVFVADQQQPLSSIDILSAQERHTLLHRWNQTDTPYPQNKTLSQLFEAQAAQRPDSTAIVFEDQSISYSELNRRANRLAHHLIDLGVKPDNLVAICLERSLNMVVGILAILKAGGAYLPLDPAYPAERLSYMLEDATPVALLTQTTLADKLTSSVPTVWLDNPAQGFDTQPDTNPDTQALGLAARHLAYVIYTSGSTGQPKGVMVEHRNVLRLIINNGFADIGPDDCVAHCANPAFDAATWEIWSGLIHGGCILLIPEKTLLHPDRFSQCLSSEGVSALFLTTALFNQYADLIAPVLSGLRYVLFGGELSNSRAAIRLRATHAPTHLLHVYGPTETTTFATAYDIPLTENEAEKLPIGRPISNTQIYILNKYGQPVPRGAVGEIYIGGDGVARGYLNQPELTAERFLADPFSSEPGAKMYKTGDLGRWLPDGNIDYLGRNDFQVKIRGFRIELGEIENALAAHPHVKQAVVIDLEHSGHKVLAAYLVVEDAVSDEMLLAHLSERLPDYMLPVSFTFMEAIPLTLNGKVNRQALPEPVFGNRESYVAPRNLLETQFCTIWQDILELERVGIEDNFFRIGGNSLLAIKLTSAIRHKMSIDIPLNILFSCKCIALLSQWLATDNKKNSLLNFLTPESVAIDKLFMIHPANGGSEPYISLANMLADNYNCIGIDNYNLSTDNKIDSLQRLAHIYMELILTEISIDKTIRILGWSLGGQLAMEIAYQLEQLGAQKIQLFLLDTVINNAEIKMLKDNIDISNSNLLITNELQRVGASDTYINKVLETASLELEISNCNLSGTLKNTNVTLFKAGEINPIHNDHSQMELVKLVIKLTDNNISQWVTKPLKIKLLNYHHNNILECTSIISMEIINESEFTEEV